MSPLIKAIVLLFVVFEFINSDTLHISNQFQKRDVQQIETEIQMKVEQLESLIEENKSGPFEVNWLSIILILLFSGSAAYYIYIINRKILSLEKNINKLLQNTNFDSFINTTKNQINVLRSDVAKVKNNISNLQFNSEIQQVKPQPIININYQKKSEILFAPSPNNDGSFDISSVSSVEDQSSSFYKFTVINNNPNYATFEFLNVERAIKDATSNPEMIIEKVCNTQNALNQNATRINTIKPGRVKKQNDKWVVELRAEIKYE